MEEKAKFSKLKALGLDVCERANGTELFGVLADIGKDGLKVKVHHGLGSDDKLHLTTVGGEVLSTSMGVVESEVLMVVDKFERDGGQCSLEYVLGGGSSTQVVETSVQAEVVRSVTNFSDTIVDQAHKTSP
jgi:hypothetical protein